MKDNFEELDQRFLEITRDLTNSLGHELLTDELIVVKEHFFNLIHQYYRSWPCIQYLRKGTVRDDLHLSG